MNPVGEFPLGNIYIRPHIISKAGEKVAGHKHNFDHVTFVNKGSVRVTKTHPDGIVEVKEFFATSFLGSFFLVKAEVIHEIEALEDNTIFLCVYSHRDPQGSVVQEYDGWADAYR